MTKGDGCWEKRVYRHTEQGVKEVQRRVYCGIVTLKGLVDYFIFREKGCREDWGEWDKKVSCLVVD